MTHGYEIFIVCESCSNTSRASALTCSHVYGHCMTTCNDYDCTYCSNGFQCIAAQRDAMFKEFLIAIG